MAAWTLLHLVVRRCVANLGVDLLMLIIGANQFRRGRQRRQAVPHPGIVGLQLDACWNLQYAGRHRSLHGLLGGTLAVRLMRGSFRLQTGVTFLRSHSDLRSYRERERGRLLGGVTVPIALGEFGDPLEDAAVAGAALLRLVPFLRGGASPQVLQPVLQALQYRLGFRLRRLNLLQMHLPQTLASRV